MKLILDGNGADDLTEQPHGTGARHDRQDLSYLRSALRGDDAAVDTWAPERLNKVGRRVSALTKRSTPLPHIGAFDTRRPLQANISGHITLHDLSSIPHKQFCS